MSKLQIIEELASTAKRNEKISILNKHLGDDLLQKCFYYALNPYYSFNIKKIPEYTSSENPSMTIDESFFILEMLRSRQVTGNEAIEVFRETLRSLPSDDAILLTRIVSRDLRCGVSVSTINKVFDKLVPTYPCLLGEPFTLKTLDKHFTAPYIAQLKSDGCRANVFVDEDGITLRGRSGKNIAFSRRFQDAFMDLILEFDGPMVFDGELVVVDKNEKPISRKKGNGIINKAIKGTISPDELNMIRIKLWDVIPTENFYEYRYDCPYSERLSLLQAALGAKPSFIYDLIETRIVQNIEEAQAYFQEMLALGEEGIMLKDASHIWEDKRSKKVLKFKADRECELEVVGWVEGTGKYTGMLGCLQCASADRKVIVSVGSGFSDKQRGTIGEDIIGTIVTVRFNEIIQSDTTGVHSLFLPRFICDRNDKDVADSYDVISKL